MQTEQSRQRGIPVTFIVEAILFDMDGTLIDSTPGVLRAWETFSRDYSLGDSLAIAHATHGRRLYDTLREYCRIEDGVKLFDEVNRFEDEVLKGGPIALPGAVHLLSKLNSTSSQWAIVTSASNIYAPRALEITGVPLPKVGLVTSNDVSHGKPHPDPYLAGAKRCGVDASKCLVVEDAVSGLKSGRAAGALTLAVCTSTSRKAILDSDANPDYIVTDLRKVTTRVIDNTIEITIDETQE